MTDPSRAPLTVADFDFSLPPGLIAQHPSAERSASRLLDGRGPVPHDRTFRDLPQLLLPGDLLVFNDTRVIKARLLGEKDTGGAVEALIERVLPHGNAVWAHLRASKSPRAGTRLRFDGAFDAEVLGRAGPGGALFHLRFPDDPHRLLQRHGHVPLPPYITHADTAGDAERYQTVFAARPGAVAAPTAALHFDAGVLAALEARGVRRAAVTLHVGAGTFQPVRGETIAGHRMHSEWFDVPAATAAQIDATKRAGGRIVAAGTTTLRALESAAARLADGGGHGVASADADAAATGVPSCSPGGPGGPGTAAAPGARACVAACGGETDIFITPGFEFRVVDLLLTNFHLPKSTLLMLVSAFTGHDRMHALYRHAVEAQYRFFSYGDAMLLQRQAAPPARLTAPSGR